MPYYHYTSRQAAQEIICTGIINPGKAGRVYLSSELYATGAAAADALGIVSKPVEIAFEISSDPPPAGLSLPFQASPVLGPFGNVIRRGGASETYTTNAVTILQDESKWLSIREP
jgi:hypothetical protein